MKRKIWVMCLVCALLGATIVIADTGEYLWTDPEKIVENDNSWNGQTTMVETEDGKLWLFYSSGDFFDYSTWEIQYKIYYHGHWSSARHLTRNSVDDCMPDAIVFNDKLWLFWSKQIEGDNYDIVYQTYENNTWSAPKKLTSTNRSEYTPRAVKTPDNKLMVVYSEIKSDESATLRYTVYNGSSWSQSGYISSSNPRNINPTIVKVNNEIWLFWQGGTKSDSQIYKSIYKDGIWSKEEKIADLPKRDIVPITARSLDGTIWLAWVNCDINDDFSYDIYLKTFKNDRWSKASPFVANKRVCDYPGYFYQASDGKLWFCWGSWNNEKEKHELFVKYLQIEEKKIFGSSKIPDTFFVDPTTENVHVKIVVGENAALEDGLTASQLKSSLSDKIDVEIIKDSEVTEEIMKNYNLILIGGPKPPCGREEPANEIVTDLVDSKASHVNWETSSGEWELIEDPWGFGMDVIIVAGKDREATQKAVEKLINDLNT